jgi:hypothetical protein
MADRIVYYLDTRSPAIVRTIASQQTGDFDVEPGQTFRLKVRPLWGDVLVIDEEMAPDVDADTLTYEPAAGDFDVEGIYRAWVSAELAAGVFQDTDEFEIAVFAHAPGEGVRVSEVWRAARALAPVAWDALRNYDSYGDIELQRQIDLAKLRVFRSAVPTANEASLDPRVIDYLAKKVLVDNVLEAAINFWTSVVVSVSARSNSDEVKTFPDRIRTAENQLKRLKEALAAQLAELTEILGPTGPSVAGPALINGGRPITPGIDEIPEHMRPFRSHSAVGWGCE